MARLVKPKRKGQILRMRSNQNDGELAILTFSDRVHIWSESNKDIIFFSGPKTLEKFAWSLLKALGKGDV